MLDTAQILIECGDVEWNDDTVRLEITMPRMLLANQTVERMKTADWTEEGDLRLIGLLEYLTDTYGSCYGPNLLLNLFMSMNIERGGEDGGATAVLNELRAGIDDLIARFSSEG